MYQPNDPMNRLYNIHAKPTDPPAITRTTTPNVKIKPSRKKNFVHDLFYTEAADDNKATPFWPVGCIVTSIVRIFLPL